MGSWRKALVRLLTMGLGAGFPSRIYDVLRVFLSLPCSDNLICGLCSSHSVAILKTSILHMTGSCSL